MAADDFQALRAKLAKLYGVHRLGKEVQRTRQIIKHGIDAGLIDKPGRFGPAFKRPAARLMRAHRQKNGYRMFEAEQFRTIIDAADQPLKAMILLGIICGFGNSDCGTLPKSAMDLKAGWVNFPRPKTAIERRCPLWPETVEAIREAIEQQPKVKDQAHDDLVFITKYGHPWAKVTADNPITKVFRLLLDDWFAPSRHRILRSASHARDSRRRITGPSAVNHIMGHADATMAGVYRERISDERLCDVVNHVRKWLFPINNLD